MYKAIKISPALRKKAKETNAKLTPNELQELTHVYSECVFEASGKKRTLSIGCASCIPDALKIVANYIDHYEPKGPRTERKTKVTKVATAFPDEKPENEMSLNELRAKYPNIKSTSKKGFREKIASQKATQ